MIDFETARTAYEVLKGLAPPYMQSMFHSRAESCYRNLRNTSTDLKIPLCKTSKGQNQLSHEIKAAPSISTFKMKNEMK